MSCSNCLYQLTHFRLAQTIWFIGHEIIKLLINDDKNNELVNCISKKVNIDDINRLCISVVYIDGITT